MANSIFKVHEMINKVGFEFDDATAKKVTQLAEKAGQLAADSMTQELSAVVAEIGDIFNQALAKIGKQQIDLADMIKMPDSSTIGKLTSNFVSQIAGNISDGITAGINDGVNKSKSLLKDLSELEGAYARHKNKSGAKTGKKVKSGLVNSVKGAFDYEPSDTAIKIGNNLRAITNEFNKATDWESQYAALLKYIKAYEALEKITSDPSSLDKWKFIGDYTIQDLKEARPEIEHSLQNIFNVAYGKAITGLTDAGDIDIGVKLTPIKMLDVYDVVGKSGQIEVEVVPVIKKAKKNVVANMYRGVHRPNTDPSEGTIEGRSVNREVLGGNYWVAPESQGFVARAYGEESGLDDAKTMKAHANALNKIQVSAIKDGMSLLFSDIDQIDFLRYLFPGIENFKNVADPEGYDLTQKFYNEMARQSGFDLLEIFDVNEGGDEIANTMVTLQNRIIEYIGNIPKYLEIEKFTPEMEQRIISQQKGSSERWYDQTIARLEQDLNDAIASEDVNKQQKLQTIIPQLKQMQQDAMQAFDNTIVSYGGYIAEEVERGLPQVITENEDGQLIGRITEESLRSRLLQYADLMAVEEDNEGYDKAQAEMEDLYSQIISAIPERLQGDADNLLNDFAYGDKSIDEAMQYFAPHLAYKDSFAPLQVQSSVEDANQVAEANRKATEEVEQKAQAEKEAAEAARQAAEEAEKEKLAQEATAKARREELANKLKEYEDDVLTSQEADVNLQERERILQQLRDEGLLTEEIENNYNEINKRLETRANLLRQAEGYYDDVSEVLTGARVSSIDNEAQYRRDHIKPFDDTITQMQASGFFADDELDKFIAISDTMEDHIRSIMEDAAWSRLDELNDETSDVTDANKLNDILEERKQILANIEKYLHPAFDYSDEVERQKEINSELEKRIALLREAQNGTINVDDIDDILQENGTLESKLERLYDVSQDWGMKIKDGEEDEAIDELEAFEETYDRIVLKLANGRNIEIFPNAKGLRALYKYSDGIDPSAYGETEIDDVIFERVSKETEAHKENTAAVQAETQAQENLNKAKKGQSYSGTIYHGSKLPLKNATYDPSLGQGRRNVGNGLYFTPELEQAVKHGKNILQQQVQLDNVFTFTEDFITDIDSLYRAMGKIKPENANWETIKKDLHATMQLPGKAQEFTENMLKMGYQGMYTKGYGYADPNVEQLVVYDEAYQKNLTTQPYNEIIKVASAAEQTVDDLNESIEKTHQLNQGAPPSGMGTGDASSAELKAAQDEAERLRQELAQKSTQTGKFDDIQKDITAEETRMKELKEVVEAVTTAVGLKTEAFKDEAIAVNTAVESEITQLGELEQKVVTIKSTLEGLLANIKTGQGDIGAGLSNIIVNVNYADTQQNDLTPIIDAISRISIQPTAVTDIGNVLATESTLSAIKTAVEAINSKVKQGAKVEATPKASTADENKAVMRYESEADSKISGNGGQKPTEKINTALTALLKYKTTLQEANQLSGDLEVGINNLYAELSQVSDKAGLTTWNEHFKQFKNASSIIQTLVKDYKALGVLQAKADAEADPTKLAHYLDNIQILQDRIDIKSVDVNVGDDRFDEAYSRAYSIERHALQQKQELADANQIEAEVVKRLIDLYEQLGRARATGNMMEASRVRGLIHSERSQLASVDYATDMKFKAAKDKGYNTERTKAENQALKEQETIVKNLTSLYQKYGDLQARAENADEGMADWYRGEAKKIEDQIRTETQKVKLVTDAMQRSFDAAYATGRDTAESDILKNLFAEDDKTSKKAIADINKLGKVYEQLGRAQAEFAHTGSLDTEHEIDSLQQLINAEKERLGLTSKQISALESKRNLAEAEKKVAIEAEQREKTRAHYAKEEEKARKKSLNQQIKEQQDAARMGRAKSVIGRATDTQTSLSSIEGVNSDVQAAAVNKLNIELQKLDAMYKAIKDSDGPISDEQAQELREQILVTDQLTKETNELIAEYSRFSGENTSILATGAAPSDLDEYRLKLTALIKEKHKGKVSIGEFDAETRTLSYTVRGANRDVTSYTAGFSRLGKEFVAVQGKTKKVEGFLQSTMRKVKEISAYFTGSSLIYKAWNEIQKGIQYVREIDSALTELKKVTDETEESYERFLDTASKTADKIGSTVKDIVSSTADWSRLGYSMQEAANLAESTSVLLNVSEFSSIDDATSALTSTLQAFGYTADQSMHVVDILNEVGNNFAISSDGIATALQDSASSLMAANNSYEEAVALIAAANRVVQDPNSVGAALRTISLRLRGTSVEELSELGEDTSGAIESISKLQSKIQSLSGVNILTDTGAYKSTYEILLEISRVFEDMSDMDQAALLEILAGKTRSNTAAAILSNTKDLEAAFKSAQEAEGSALRENEKYLDSIQGRIDLFNNSVQTMWNNTLDDDLIKGIVNLGTEIVKIIDQIGLIPSALAVFGTAKIVPSLIKAATGTNTLTEAFKGLVFGADSANKSIGELIINLWQMLPVVGQNISKAAKAIPTLVQTGHAFGGLKGALSGAAAGFKGLWAAIPGVGKIILVAAAIGAVIAAIDALTVSAKEAAEAAEEALTKYKNAQDTLRSHKQTIEEISDEYKKLSKGVDAFGKNVNLTTEEYERYNEIANQIADMFPQMVSGYTEEGNAIIALKGNVEALTEAYKAEAQAANDAILIKSNEIFDTFKNNTSNSGSLWTGKINKIEDLKYLEDLLDGKLDNFEATDFGGTTGLQRWFDEAGIKGKLTGDLEDYMEILRENLPKIQAYYRILKSEIDSAAVSVRSMLNAYLSQDFDYAKLSSDAQNIVHSIVQTFDSEFYNQFDNVNELQAYVTENIVKPLQDTNTSTELQVAFDLQTKLNNGEVKIEDYQTKIQEIISLIDALDLDKEDQIIKSLRLVFDVDDSGVYESSKQEVAKNLLEDQYDEKVGELTAEDLNIIDKYATEWSVNGTVLLSWEQLIEKLKEAKQIAEETSITDSLSKITALEKAYNALGDAIKEFKEDGIASAGTLEGLKETFGDTEGFEDLYKILATGEGDVEAAISNVANAYMNQQGILSDLTADEQKIMIARLKALGVINAEELVQSRKVAQEKLNVAYQQYGIDLSTYATAEEAKLMIAQQMGLDLSKISDNNVEDLARHYGIDLSNYATLAEKKIAIAREMAKEQKKLALADAANDYQTGEIDWDTYRNKKREIYAQYDDILSESDFTNISSIVNDYFKTSVDFDFSDQKIGIGSDFDDTWAEDPDKQKSDAFQKEMDYWENQISANQAKYEQIQNEIDLLEKQGKLAGKEYYQEQINLENERLELLEKQKAEAKKYTGYIDENGKKIAGIFQEGSDEWWDAANTLNDLEGEIDDVTASLQDLRDAQAEVDWYIFDEAHERFSKLHDDLETVRDLLAPNQEEDWFDDEGNWTDKGTAYLASYISDLQFYEGELESVNKKLTEQYHLPYAGNEKYYKTLGIDSEQELYDAREKLIDQQYDIRKAQSDTQQSVADMYESQIDAVEEYTNELVDAYNDYIDVVKEALDAERDLYEFKKDVQKQTKDIASLERRIASLSGSDNAADIAERRKLEAELIDARESLNDTYYDHAKDAQSEALDKEAEAYEKSMNKFIEGLHDALDAALLDIGGFMGLVANAVVTNAPAIKEQYESLGISLDSAIIDPWTEAANKIKAFGGIDGLGIMNSWVTEGGAIYDFDTNATKLLQSPWAAGTKALDSFKTSVTTKMGEVVTNVKSNVDTIAGDLNRIKSLYSEINSTTIKAPSGGGDNTGDKGGNGGQINMSSASIKALQEVLNTVFKANLTVDGKYGPKTKEAITKVQKELLPSHVNGKYDAATRQAMDQYILDTIAAWRKQAGSSMIGQGIRTWLTARGKLPVEYYAKGTIGTKQDQWAVTDEIGDEIVLVPGLNGNLQYMRKGTAVIPADISTNLVEWGKLNPDMFNVGGAPNLNMISNAVNKPEFNMSFDSLVHVDHCDEGTLRDLEKMVDTKINQFSKQMNYAIKKIGGR